MFLSSDGDGIALYPLGTFDEPNFAYREYFRIARDTGKPYTSNVFEARSDNEQRKVIVVAVPFINKSNFVGVMTASVNILALGEKLQRVAVGSGGEYFLIVDEEGKIVIAPETTSIGASIAESDLLRRALIGEQGVALDRLDDGELGMVAYRKFSNSPWALSLRAPASRVYTIGQSAVASVFAVVGLIMLTSLLFLSTLQIRVKRPREASP
ncbi:MAG: hypothetical protein ACD_36C00051G0001 [uncultured bacterium]|nr:MAG: hypothetical protein ACD_36C00051G0001 [uncultured bacterium]